MQEFLEIAKTDFTATFEGAWIFPLLLVSVACVFRLGQNRVQKLMFGLLPCIFLAVYWCPLTGMLFMRLLGENVYWRILWLILPAMVIPCAGFLIVRKFEGIRRQALFLLLMAVTALGGKSVLSREWFEASTNVYKVPQYVVSVCDLLPENVHVLASNRLTPYLRLYDPSLTLAYARNALIYNAIDADGPLENLYRAVQEPEIDLSVAAPLAREEGCTFIVLSASRTFQGEWEDYGYRKYGETDEFVIFADIDYEEGQDTRKWED